MFVCYPLKKCVFQALSEDVSRAPDVFLLYWVSSLLLLLSEDARGSGKFGKCDFLVGVTSCLLHARRMLTHHRMYFFYIH